MRRLQFNIKQIKLLVPCLILALPLMSQRALVSDFSSIDTKALKLADSLTNTGDDISKYIISNFRSGREKTRAIRIWIAKIIQYDIDNMFTINFYEWRADKISNSLQSRKGICESYASLFNDICLKSGIKSFIIEGGL